MATRIPPNGQQQTSGNATNVHGPNAQPNATPRPAHQQLPAFRPQEQKSTGKPSEGKQMQSRTVTPTSSQNGQNTSRTVTVNQSPFPVIVVTSKPSHTTGSSKPTKTSPRTQQPQTTQPPKPEDRVPVADPNRK